MQIRIFNLHLYNLHLSTFYPQNPQVFMGTPSTIGGDVSTSANAKYKSNRQAFGRAHCITSSERPRQTNMAMLLIVQCVWEDDFYYTPPSWKYFLKVVEALKNWSRFFCPQNSKFCLLGFWSYTYLVIDCAEQSSSHISLVPPQCSVH